DRDIAVEVVAKGLDPLTLTAGDVMTGSLVTARADDSILHTLQVMRRAGVRRVPVLSADGTLHGMVTLDDLLGIAAEAMDGIAAAIGSERASEARLRQ
ncbi:MAG TPA: CBS domain-containing protein, partial [Usitatibacter sp.]